MRKVLPQSFFNKDTHTVARELLGKFIVRSYSNTEISGMITEIEIYDGHEDMASHARAGVTPRTQLMFETFGHWYVYLIYGIHYLLNITTRESGHPAAILIRSVEGISGPGRVTKYFHINKALNGAISGKKSGLWIEDRGITVKDEEIEISPRIGVDYAGEWKDKELRLVWRKQQK